LVCSFSLLRIDAPRANADAWQDLLQVRDFALFCQGKAYQKNAAEKRGNLGRLQ